MVLPAIKNNYMGQANSIASSTVLPRNWASFDLALREKFSSRGLQFFGLSFAIPFRYFGIAFGLTTRIKV